VLAQAEGQLAAITAGAGALFEAEMEALAG
jgi:hypothetical protein